VPLALADLNTSPQELIRFDFGRIRASGAKLTGAQLSGERLRDQIAREVLEGYTRVQSLFGQLRVARFNLNAAEETLRLTRGRKQLGVGVLLEDIQAQQELLKARGDRVTIVTELNQQQYALLHSVGYRYTNPSGSTDEQADERSTGD